MASRGPSPLSQPGSQSQSGTPGTQLGASPAAGSTTVASQPQPAQPSQPAQQQSQLDLDPISRVKALIPHLKESLSNLMKIAALGFHHSALIDNASQKASDNIPQRFDKSLEEFYSICDQVELHLRLALDCSNQYVDSIRHTPLPVSTAKSEPTNSGESQTYSQYVSTVKSQVAYAKEIHDALLECSNKLGEGKT
ncbi:mediator of RNA polymerase II transcription subunit 29-like [Acanthaster planci]|uniref:Mediator of RNA polymerase II transcription subunit 29 n=1 Tax=Acanthaster planci TaxID=133434 RepID=A0A8B7XSS4_ACAPL|nr:mediator of RNA polymerase II transcription subunit 29-like [Acanthaster planci]